MGVSELIREAFILSLKPDVVLITSMFENEAIMSIGKCCKSIPTVTILYDLIPYIYSNLYLSNELAKDWYMQKLEHLSCSDMLFAISESSRNEAITDIKYPAEKVISIGTAAESCFKPVEISKTEQNCFRLHYKISREFVMYTGGIDFRKNIEGLIRAYGKLPIDIRNKHQLVIVCHITTDEMQRLTKLGIAEGLTNDELIFTGYVPDSDLLIFYNLCKVFVFPSWHEGFGLPALEALQCGRAVIGSNTTSIPEVIGRDDALFAPKDDCAITEKLLTVLTNDAFRFELEQYGPIQAKKFSWDKTAQKAINALETYLQNSKMLSWNYFELKRPRLALVSPLRPIPSGISDYASELIPFLSKYYAIDVIVDKKCIQSEWIKDNFNIRDSQWFTQHAHEYDRVLYHFGNSPYHRYMLKLLDEIPGVVVLHDFYLSGIISDEDFPKDAHSSWLKELYRSHGYKAIYDLCMECENVDVALKYPCNLSVLQRAYGVIVHSSHAIQLAKDWYDYFDFNEFYRIPLLRVPKTPMARPQARQNP